MRYLIDTHTLLWLGTESARVPASCLRSLRDTSNSISVSIASLWEIGIKHSTGKRELPTSILGMEEETRAMGIEIVPISVSAIHQMTLLPWHHKDPFDRMIAATSLVRGELLISADRIFDSYGVSRLWD